MITTLSTIATLHEDVLGNVLSAIHGAGLGATARVLSPARMPIEHALRQTSVSTARMPERIADAERVLVVHSAGRSHIAANIALAHGATAVWIIDSAHNWQLVDDGEVTESGTPSTGVSIRMPQADPEHVAQDTADF